MWYKQSVKDRMEAMKLYRKAYPGFSYKEMVQHFNNGGEFGEPRKGPVAEPTPFEGSVGMMKAKMAYANEFGNPAAKRMVSPNPKTGMTPKGEGTHYMTSIDNYAVPLLQDKGGKNLEFNNNPLPSPEDIKFDNAQDAQYFAKHYKEVAPMMRNSQQHKYGGIQQFDNGGYKSEAEYKAHLLDPYSAEKRTAQIAWLKNNKPITYREDFKPGMLSNIPGLSSLASGNQFGLNRYEMYGPLGDLYRYYGGQPLAHNVLVESKNKPSNSKDKNAKYISLNNDPTFVNEILDNYKRVTSGNLDKGIENKLSNNSWAVSGYSSAGPNAHKTTKQGSEHHSNAIGRYTLSKGTDEKGDYISYYDKFDQGTGSGINPGEMLGLTKPFEIYDRIYIDSKTGKPIVQQHRYGGLQKFGDGGKKDNTNVVVNNGLPIKSLDILKQEHLKEVSDKNKRDVYLKSLRTQMDSIQNQALKTNNIFDQIAMRQTAGSIYQTLLKEKPELVKKELNTSESAGKAIIASSKYIFPATKPLVNTIEGMLAIKDIYNNPNMHNTANLMTEVAPFINNKYAKTYQLMGDYLTGEEIINPEKSNKPNKK